MPRPAFQQVDDRAIQQNFDEVFRNWPDSNVQLTAFVYSNGWRNYTATANDVLADVHGGWVGWYKDPYGFVNLAGLIDKAGGNWVSYETIATLPAGARPNSTRLFSTVVEGGGVLDAGRVDVYTDGTIKLVAVGSRAVNPVGWLTLEGLRFKAYK